MTTASPSATRLTYEPVIGLEIHAQLLTRSKMFCGCSTTYADAPPNTHVCPVCLGLPGVLPVINGQAVRYTVMTALALHCSIPEYSKFDRKNYAYPDLMKGYQISQYDMPLSRNGWLEIKVDGHVKRVGIVRVHLEEDTGKLLHRGDGPEPYSLLDTNRAGIPLMEIVSEPQMNSPEEARAYFMTLRNVLQYLGVNNGDMEKGSLRCDVNISLRPAGTTTLGVKTEIKNINSFRSVLRALEYEIDRQQRILESGGTISQETRGWSEDRGETIAQRSKEAAHDYRYFPEPDLPPLTLSREIVDEIARTLPELASDRAARFEREYGLSEAAAAQLTVSRDTADYYERTVDVVRQTVSNADPRVVANWIVGDLQGALNAAGQDLNMCKITPQHIAGLIRLLSAGVLSSTLARQVFEEMFVSGEQADTIVRVRGLMQLSDTSELSKIIADALVAGPQAVQAVADYKAGKTASIQFLIGQIMKATRGKADPTVTRRLLQEALDSAPEDKP